MLNSKARDRMVVKALRNGDIAVVGNTLKEVTDNSFSFYIAGVQAATPKALLEAASTFMAENGRVRDANSWVAKMIERAEYVEPELTPVLVEEKKTRKPRRPYHEMMTELLELGTFTKNEMLEAIIAFFPEQKKVSVETCLIDLRRPQYSAYKDNRYVIRNFAGKLMFADARLPN